MKSKSFATVLIIAAALSAPFAQAPVPVSAHEAYVLTPDEINRAVSMPSQDPFEAVPEHEAQFLFWGALIAVGVLATLAFSDARWSENTFSPLLLHLKRYAPFIGRLTFGLAMFASGYFGAFFGPELPATALLGATGASIFSWALMAAGVLICLGFLTRLMGFFGLAVFALAVARYHIYMLTYVNYLGEILLFLILGGGMWSLDSVFAKRRARRSGRPAVLVRFKAALEKYSFLILRVLFGTALFFASFYAKFLHSNLALDTVNDYHLTNYFHFSQLFLVLGAFLVEALLGACFFFGFQIRLASIVFTVFLTMSILFFGEAVWPHIILFGVNFALFSHGYDEFTVGYWLNRLISRRRKRKWRLAELAEPVL